MDAGDLRDEIYRHLPGLDQILETEQVPVSERIIKSAILFIDLAVEA